MLPAHSQTLNIPPNHLARNNATGLAFDHELCRDLILAYTTSPETNYTPTMASLIFAQAPNGSFYSGQDNMTITIPACQQLCETNGIDWYTDKGPRLMTWIIPIVLLLSNIELSPLDKRRFYTLLQALGNPIDVLWSFVHKIVVRSRIYGLVWQVSSVRLRESRMDVRVVATVLAGFEEILGPDVGDYGRFVEILRVLGPTADDGVMGLWKATALELADSRTDEQLRSGFAVILYVVQILSAFVFEIGGGSPNPPGGVIAVALTLTFLIPMVLLSAVTGAFTSRRTCLRILKRFVEDVRGVKGRDGNGLDDDEALQVLGEILIGDDTDTDTRQKWDEYFKNLHWRGGKDAYRPWKMRRYQRIEQVDDTKHGAVRSAITWYKLHSHSLVHFLAATCPVLAGLAGGLGLLFLAGEAGWSCRHIMILSILGTWLLSVALSSLSYGMIAILCPPSASLRWRTGEWHWRFCFIKDSILGAAVLVFICLSAAGFFNSCTCWGREIFAAGEGKVPVVVLNVNRLYVLYNTSQFPGIVSGVVGFQLVFTGLVIWVNWKGYLVLRWSEKVRQACWRELCCRGGDPGHVVERIEASREEQRGSRRGGNKGVGGVEVGIELRAVTRNER